jgi:hypothetical protein
MTEESPSGIGTVAQEAARLIEDMATMARSGYGRGDAPGPYAGESAREPSSPGVPPTARHTEEDEPADRAGRAEAGRPGGVPPEGERPEGERPRGGPEAESSGGESPDGPCRMCGGESEYTHDDTPSTCKICPLCRGIALMRSVRPETVDLLADLALSLAATLRDVATRSRASDPGPFARSASGGPPAPGRDSVQDIQVDDENEGGRW